MADTHLFAVSLMLCYRCRSGKPGWPTLFVNPAFSSTLGINEEELRGKHCVDFSPAEDAEKDWALFQRLRAGSIDHYQLEKPYFR
jgi:PAS domain S-box-containing protein